MLTLERLRAIVHYDQDAGVFTSKIQRGKHRVGARLGHSRDDGYRLICIDYVEYLEHRLAIFYVTGCWPTSDIDHIDRDAGNNRLVNLRMATRGQNLANAKRPKHNTSGYKGVAWHSRARKWRAEISVDGDRRYLGLFGTKEAAHAAYRSAALQARGHFARMD